MTALDLIFTILAALLILGNIVIRIKNEKRIQLIYNLSILALLSILIIIGSQTVQLPHTYLNLFSVNPFSVFFMLIFTISMAIVNLLAFAYSDNYADFALLSDFTLLGIYFIALSSSLLTLFIGLELGSLPVVFILLLSKKSIESATKFFIMASIAVAVLSFAIALFYTGQGSLSLGSPAKNGILAFASILFIVSLGIDSSLFPFNLLIPDVYEGAQAHITSMLGGIIKKMGFLALIQVLILCFIAYQSSFEIIAILSVLTMFYGNLVATMQTSIKRVFAYSSISQSGYILIGLATATSAGLSASLFQIFAHMFAFIGLFSVVSLLESKNKSKIEDLMGLNGENRFAAFAMAVFMLSFLGIPLTTGFVGKFLLFLSAVNSGLLWLAILGIVNSIISIYYYARILTYIYSGKEKQKGIAIGKETLAAIAICLAITIIIGVYPQPLITVTNNAAAFLLKP